MIPRSAIGSIRGWAWRSGWKRRRLKNWWSGRYRGGWRWKVTEDLHSGARREDRQESINRTLWQVAKSSFCNIAQEYPMKRLQVVGFAVALLLGLSEAIAQDTSDKDKKELLTAYRQARTLMDEGKWAEAIEQNEKAVALALRVFGPDDPNTAAALYSLGELQRRMGKYSKADALLRRSLEIAEAKQGKDHPNVGNILNSLGILQQELSEYSKAEALFQRSLTIVETQLGKN